ncbi:glycoside hydrolase family 13 protein [Rummeliibacillus pycnus]|uniref:glycoside hydrolase family 13 protein n=1 Tax=Rummeliibacillus pycnus TaxID=101070 RepID=UPI003D2937F2
MDKLHEPWWKRSVVYQIYPRSFMDSNGDGIGDIRGIISKLEYLLHLGVDIIWLSPIYDSPNADNGYDIRDYFKIMEEFGTMEDFDELIFEARKYGIRIILDLVVNHTSDEHAWFVESRTSRDSNYRDYYIWREGQKELPPNNWGSMFSGSAWEKEEQTGDYYLHLFSKKQPDLNWDNPQVRNEVFEMMDFWLNKGISGFRMDVINFISKDSRLLDGKMRVNDQYGDGSPYFINGPNIHTHLQEMHEKVFQHNDVLTIGEMPGTTPEDAKVYTKPENKELQMIFTFEHMNLDSGPHEKWDLKPLDLIDLKNTFDKWQQVLHEVGWNSLYWNNHDQPRIVSRFGNDSEVYRELSGKMLAICLHMMQGTPFIYQGEEIAMTNVRFKELEEFRDIETFNMYKTKRQQGMAHKEIMESIYAKGRDNARTPMQWTKTGGFTTGNSWIAMNDNTSIINVEDTLKNPSSIFYTYQKLIQLRKENDILTYGTFELLLRENPNLFVYKRKFEQQEWIVVANFAAKTEQIAWENFDVTAKKGNTIITNYESPLIAYGMINVRPYEAFVIEVGGE